MEFLILHKFNESKRKRKSKSRRRILNLIQHQYITKAQRSFGINFLLFLNYLPKQRRYWMMHYDQAWFEKMWHNRYDLIFTELWLKEFRVGPETFHYIVSLVQVPLQKQDTTFRKAVTIEKRVAVGMWRLASGNSYRTII